VRAARTGLRVRTLVRVDQKFQIQIQRAFIKLGHALTNLVSVYQLVALVVQALDDYVAAAFFYLRLYVHVHAFVAHVEITTLAYIKVGGFIANLALASSSRDSLVKVAFARVLVVVQQAVKVQTTPVL
jgi:hypothetical protein